MANAIEKVNAVAITDIEAINGKTDDNIQAFNGLEFTGVTDAHTLIATVTASSSASLAFTSGIDSTYDVYEFVFTNLNPASDSVDFTFQVNATDGADYNDSLITSTFLAFYSDEPPETGAGGGYDTGRDAVQLDEEIKLAAYAGSDTDESISGRFTLYAPSSTTYVKHFQAEFSTYKVDPAEYNTHIAGYINDTTAIDDIRFKMSSGNIDSGVVKMYGLAKS